MASTPAADTHPSGVETVDAPSRKDWIALAALAAGLGMIVLDGTIVGVALPAIIQDLHLNLTDAQWVNSLYAVLLAALLLSTGKLADRWGRKTMFMVGLVVFAGGSLLAALSGTAGALIASRAVQALGAAFIMPSTLSIITAVFPPDERPKAIGAWAAVSGLGIAIGPVAGGWLIEHANWHWIFLVNIPFVAAALTTPPA